MKKLLFAATLLYFSFTINSNAQNTSENNDLKVYLDCRFCDNTYLKQNLSNVQFVRDQDQGDLHLFFLAQGNGSGGRRYDVSFIGKNDFGSINYKMSFSTNSNMTNDDVRKLILEYIKLGLVRFWIQNNSLDGVSVSIPEPNVEVEENLQVKDPWNYWFF